MTRRGGKKLAIFLGVPILAIVLLVIFWRWDWFIPIVESQASSAIGRKVTIAHLHVRLGRTTRIIADDVTVARAFHPGAAVARRIDIALMPAILRPLPRIAEHAVEAERVGRETVDVGQRVVVELAAAAVAVGVAAA